MSTLRNGVCCRGREALFFVSRATTLPAYHMGRPPPWRPRRLPPHVRTSKKSVMHRSRRRPAPQPPGSTFPPSNRPAEHAGGAYVLAQSTGSGACARTRPPGVVPPPTMPFLGDAGGRGARPRSAVHTLTTVSSPAVASFPTSTPHHATPDTSPPAWPSRAYMGRRAGGAAVSVGTAHSPSAGGDASQTPPRGRRAARNPLPRRSHTYARASLEPDTTMSPPGANAALT